MEIIILILIGIVILYRIYRILQEIKLVVKHPKFKKGVMIVISYMITTSNMVIFTFNLSELSYTLNSKILSLISNFLGVTTCVGAIIIMVFLIKEYEEVKLPFKLILLILTLGLVIYSIYSLTNKDKQSSESEFVNPHEVKGYTRKDGTTVSGYWRDGDGDPTTVLTKENGGGYWRDK